MVQVGAEPALHPLVAGKLGEDLVQDRWQSRLDREHVADAECLRELLQELPPEALLMPQEAGLVVQLAGLGPSGCVAPAYRRRA